MLSRLKQAGREKRRGNRRLAAPPLSLQQNNNRHRDNLKKDGEQDGYPTGSARVFGLASGIQGQDALNSSLERPDKTQERTDKAGRDSCLDTGDDPECVQHLTWSPVTLDDGVKLGLDAGLRTDKAENNQKDNEGDNEEHEGNPDGVDLPGSMRRGESPSLTA